MKKSGSTFLAMGMTFLVCAVDTVTCSPADDGRALSNPGMGWQCYYYDNVPANYGRYLEPGDSAAWFPGCNQVYLRFPWSMIEPEEGVFNWAAVDSVMQRFTDRGCQVSFRITASEGWCEYATPKWVFDAGAKAIRCTWQRGPDPNGKFVDPDFNDPVFLAKLDALLKVFADRYDGDERIAFIDIGSFGMWGEGHTGFSVKFNKEQTEKAVRAHIDLHCRHFKKTLLAISDDVDGPWNVSGNWPLTDYARSKGVTLRDDSILVSKKPNQWKHAEMADRFWRTLPVIVESGHFRECVRDASWDGELLYQSVEAYHASFMAIHGDAREIFEDSPAAIARINRRLGYRFNLREVSWPKSVRVGRCIPNEKSDWFGKTNIGLDAEPFSIRWAWANVGVAPCYCDAYPALTVKNDKGNVLAVLVDDAFNLKTLETAEPGKAVAKESSKSFTLGRWFMPNLPAGTFDVYVSVGKVDGTPVYELPYPYNDGHRRYKLGKMEFIVGRP